MESIEKSVEYKREFVGLEVSMTPCSYINGGKAPYYSIVYRENGQLLQGYSSFDIGTVSKYLRDYFIDQGRNASDKPGTAKDLLKRMADEVYNDSRVDPFDRDFIVEKYANKLYELQRQA